MRRRCSRASALLMAIVALGLLALWILWLAPLQEHRRWHDRVRESLVALAGKRPPERSREEWQFVVCWTLQLHANCGWPGQLDHDGREAFAVELKRRLAGPVNLDTIDWIWDEYSQFSRSGRIYSDNFRPTHPDNFKQANDPFMSDCGIVVP